MAVVNLSAASCRFLSSYSYIQSGGRLRRRKNAAGSGARSRWSRTNIRRREPNSLRLTEIRLASSRSELGSLRRMLVRLQRRSEEHTSELQSLTNLVCRLLLEKK